MKVTTAMIYKTNYTDTKHEIHFYPTVEIAETAAQAMIDSFRYWGGGAVPCEIVSTKWTKRGYKTLYRNTFNPAEWESFAKANGSNYGYNEYTHGKSA